ncbi:hypothetical protein FRC07_006031 [Ceratobasidium sp. 392]|nr:hypothetical protein FRC07_006031 [Ceratobasidium sp. 392]
MPKAKTDATETQKPSLFKRGQDKVEQMWINWGKEKGGWKLKVHTYGEKLIDRVDFEELALASTDTSLGPKASQLSAHDSEGKRLAETQSKTHSISVYTLNLSSIIYVIYRSPNSPSSPSLPPIALTPPSYLVMGWNNPINRSFCSASYHTKPAILLLRLESLDTLERWAYRFVSNNSLAHPCVILAHKASAYLLELVDQDAIKPTTSEELDKIYEDGSPSRFSDEYATPITSNDPNADPAIALLLPNPTVTIPRILDAYGLPAETERSLSRAVEQARLRSEADGDIDDD